MKKTLKISMFLLFTIVLSNCFALKSDAAVTLNDSKIIIAPKNSYTLKVSGTKKNIKWSTSKKSIAKVSKNGKVTGKKKGTAYITAKIGKKRYKCKVVVMDDYDIASKLIDAYNWQCKDIWNNGFCDIYHYIEYGSNSYGKSMNPKKVISQLNLSLKKKKTYNNFVTCVKGKKYKKFKTTWNKLYKETNNLSSILKKNGTPKPFSNYYFPYEKYRDYLYDLMAYVY